MTTLPAHDTTIIFDHLPIRSYASLGVPYRATVSGKGAGRTVHLRNLATGGGTMDKAFTYRDASFRTVEEAAA